MKQQNEVVYISYEDALDLVDRIAERAVVFHHTMSKPEKEAMAQLLSDIGVKVSDLINVDNLADNYAINAEIVYPDEIDNYDPRILKDALFKWIDGHQWHYCLSW